MGIDYGKDWEVHFKQDWKRTFPKTPIIRLYDQVTGFKTVSQNPSDFIAFNNGRFYLLECKSTQGNTFNLKEFVQYERLLQYKDMENTFPLVIIWFIDHDKVFLADIKTIEKMVMDGKKSIHAIKSIQEGYRIVEVPSIKKRIFLECDYSFLKTYQIV